MLAALAEPTQPPEASADMPLSARKKPAPPWNDDDLAEDVATLSYESALKAHARYRPSQFSDRSLTQPVDPEPFCYEEASSYAAAAAPQPAAQNLKTIPAMEPRATSDQDSRLYRAAPIERNLKDASITIRMSKVECVQLHCRAAEAGLTVSAYLRSCTFEAESLRTMVKDTLAQLRSVTTQAKSARTTTSGFRRLTRWLHNLLTPWNGSQRTART
jgi:predicted DNA binding CopG/RHH family protein